MSPVPADKGAPRRRLCLAVRLAAAVLVLLLAGYFGLGALIVLRMTRPERHHDPQRTPQLEQLVYQDVRIPARGGDAQLAGFYVPQTAKRNALVLVHGKDSSRTSQFGGRMVELLAQLHRRGYAVLAIDLRGHGQSSDARLSFGINEQRDVLGAVDWLLAQGFAPGSIGVLGVSMGGASAILAAAREPAIGAVVDDCAYADVEPIVRARFASSTGLPLLFLTPARLVGRLLDGYDIFSVRPVDQVAKLAPRPLLIIHGDADLTTPVTQAYALHSAYPQSQMWILPGVGHAAAYSREPASYVDRVASFFANSLAH